MAKSLFYIEDPVLVSARNLEAAKAWYKTVFECTEMSVDDEGNSVLGWKDQPGGGGVVIGPPTAGDTSWAVPIFFTRNLEKSHAALLEKGVDCGPVQADSAGVKFFEFRDLEGNRLEVCAG